MKRTLTRVSTLAKVNDDASSLFGWKQEMVLRGIRAGADLTALLATLDPEGPKDKYRALAKQAEERAAASAAGNVGTATHAAVETVLHGGSIDQVPEAVRKDAEAVVLAMEAVNLTVLMSEAFVVVDELAEPVGGSFDHLVRGVRGAYILDVKTASGPGTAKYAGLSWATQTAIYAHGTPYFGQIGRDRWTRPVIDDVPENYGEWPEKPDQSVGIIASIVRGSGHCDLLKVDLDLGWQAAQLACEVRAMRKARVVSGATA